MMRQCYKDEKYFEQYFFEQNFIINRSLDWIAKGVIPVENVKTAKRGIGEHYFRCLVAKYTLGEPIDNSFSIFIYNAIDHIYNGWDSFGKLHDKEGREYNQYILGTYDEMLWMLSLGYLLDIANKDFQKLVDIIDRDCVKDFLFEFIIRAKIEDRKPITKESYEHGWILFGKLRQAIVETDKVKVEGLVKGFVTKDWYKEHKSQGWYNNHKSPHHTYNGYWSFETAAVVKIMGLDDSSFKNCPYYPKDLVNY